MAPGREQNFGTQWVEKSGRTDRKNIELNAAPIDIADYLRQLLFGSDTSIVMTSATLAVSENRRSGHGLDYFARRVGGESASFIRRKLRASGEDATGVKTHLADSAP